MNPHIVFYVALNLVGINKSDHHVIEKFDHCDGPTYRHMAPYKRTNIMMTTNEVKIGGAHLIGSEIMLGFNNAGIIVGPRQSDYSDVQSHPR